MLHNLQVIEHALDALRIFLEQAKGLIARITEQRPNASGPMTVVYIQHGSTAFA
jgi:hypothetical protein